MSKVNDYREILRSRGDWEPLLLQESRLPGPRSNLELAQAVAEEGDQALFERLLSFDAARAPVNSPHEFLAVCGVLGLGRLLSEGQSEWLPTLRRLAADPRWRTREAVAMALQRWGALDMGAILEEMARWSQGGPLEQRAAVAALCEPALLSRPEQVQQVLRILDAATAALEQGVERGSPAFLVLKKGLGYAWSVAVAAQPEVGRPAMEKWLKNDNPDVRWVMRENLRKKRLARLDQAWVAGWLERLGYER